MDYNLCPKRYRRGLVRAAVAYPGGYRLALSSLVYHQLYYLLCMHDGVAVERVVETGSGYVSLDSASKLKDFDLVFVPLHYEFDYLKLAEMLGDLPPEKRPIVIVGGPTVMANPIPVSGLIDAAVIGEAEPVLHRIVDIVAEYKGLDRRRIREELSSVDGIYVPGVRDSGVREVIAWNLDVQPYPARQLQNTEIEPIWGRSFLLEVTRGCFRSCRFCMEGCIFRAKRERSLSVLKRLLEAGLKENRTGKVTFLSLSFFDHSEGERVLEVALELGASYSVPSMRVDLLNDHRLELIARGGQRTLTIAPETGSPRIAEAINKAVTKSDTIEVVAKAFRIGFHAVKLYLMIGFPGESPEDVKATIELMKSVARVAKEAGKEVRFAVNPFMPKPYTPLQWLNMMSVEYLRRVYSYMKHALSGGLYGRFTTYDPRWAAVQVALSRFSSDASRLLLLWKAHGGGLAGWRRACREAGVNVKNLLARIDPDVSLPWLESVRISYTPVRYLRREYDRYRQVLG